MASRSFPISIQYLNSYIVPQTAAFQYSRAALGKEDWIVLLFLLVAVLFGLLILLFVLVLMRDKHHKKKCPFCAESVRLDAIVCKHCGRELISESS